MAERFAVKPKQPEGLWRKPPSGIDLRHILCARAERRVLNDNTVKHEGRRFQLEKGARQGSLAGKSVEVQNWFDNSIHIVVQSIHGPTDWKFTELQEPSPYKKISGITDHYHHTDLFTHKYF